MLKAYVTLSDYNKNALDILRSIPLGVTVRPQENRPLEDELCELVNDYDILIIGAKEKMTDKVYSNANRLKIIGTLSIGLDHIDPKFFSAAKIKIVNCPNSNVVSTAEHTIALILALCKKLVIAHRATISLEGRKGLGGLPIDLSGKTLGVLGAGRIGSQVIEISKNFGMHVLCHTLHPEAHSNLNSLNVEFVSLEELFSRADILTVHVPLNENTRKSISDSLIGKMKKNSILVNAARAAIIDYNALSKALQNDKLFGVGIDIDIEDRQTIKILSKYDNVILTPHTAGVSIDAINRMDIELATNIKLILIN